MCAQLAAARDTLSEPALSVERGKRPVDLRRGERYMRTRAGSQVVRGSACLESGGEKQGGLFKVQIAH